MHKNTALKIIEQNKKSYDKIAEDFNVTRKFAWPEFDLLKPYIKKEDSFLDIGCGNARLAQYLIQNLKFKIQNYFGIDFSDKFIKIAKNKFSKAQFKTARKIWELPFKDNEFNTVAGIAFLHHIPSWELRAKVLAEIYRVLQPGGILFLTNWNLWQLNRIKKYKLKLRDFFFGHSDLEKGDFWISFHGQKRYYHHFTKRELFKLSKRAGFKVLKYKLGMNSVMVLKKELYN